MSDSDINSLEEVLAYQEKKISDLSDIVTKQWDEIDMLKKSLGRMQEKVSELEDNISSDDSEGNLSVTEQAARDKPPHY